MENKHYIEFDGDFWFNQKNMAKILGIRSHTVNWHIKEIEKIDSDFNVKKFKVSQKEGNRMINRNIKHYPLENFFDIAMRCNRLKSFNETLEEMRKDNEIKLDFKVRPIKERNFKEILNKTLDGVLDFKYQYRVRGFIVDFYCP